jgi:integrase
MKLTDTAIRKFKSPEKPKKLADGGGLYLEVLPSGSKLWRLKYRFNGKENRLSLGKYPIVTLDMARKKRDDAKSLLLQGIDPSLAKKEQALMSKVSNASTFEAIALEWLDKRAEEVKKDTARDIKNRLEKELFPKIGSLPIKSITSPILLQALKAIEARGVYETTKRCRQYAGQIFRYAIATGRAEIDPSQAIIGALKTRKVEHHKAMESDEIPEFLRKIEANESRLYRQTILCLKLMNLTFTRKRELTEATWDEIDFEKAMWTIPENRMKMEKSHLVPLSRQAIKILEELKTMNGHCEYVFTSIIAPKKHMNPDTPLRALYSLGYKGIHTAHGFRALAMTTILENLKWGFEVVDCQLAHGKRGKLGATYDRARYLKDRIPMMQDWADYLDSLLLGELAKNNNVVKFSKII